MTGLSFPTVWNLIRKGKFPKPVLVTGKDPRWFADEVAAWQSGLPRAEYKPLPTEDDEIA